MTKKTLPEPTINAADYAPTQVAPNGTKVRIQKGQIPDQDGKQTIASAGGMEARIDGAPYVAKGGPNKGRTMQPVKVEGAGKDNLLAVPAEDLHVQRGSKSRGNFTTGFKSDEQHRKVFGRTRGESPKKWVEVAPGRHRLV